MLDVPYPRPGLSLEGPLRILFLISYPTDLTDLGVEEEWRRVQAALQRSRDDGTIVVDRLPATMPEVRRWLDTSEVHILHFIGHGDYDTRLEDGLLYFTDKYGRADPVAASRLGSALADHDPLRLVVLNACQTARADGADPFNGMAQSLVRKGCSAVVAMQFPISDGAAGTFTETFYGRLAEGYPVDQAVSRARQALLDGYPVEWATPVVFLRSGSPDIFNIAPLPVHLKGAAIPGHPSTLPPGATISGPATVLAGPSDAAISVPERPVTPQSFVNFDILFEPAKEGSFLASVHSPVGTTHGTRFSLPFDEVQLENMMLRLNPSSPGTWRIVSDPRIGIAEQLGGLLFEALFSGDIRKAWYESLDHAREHNGGLRARLDLTATPSLTGLPWEMLYDPEAASFIAQSEWTPVTRYLARPYSPRPLTVNGPLKVLLVVSSPLDLPPVDVEGETWRVRQALSAQIDDGRVALSELPLATIGQLATWLRKDRVHIVHFIGHGEYDDRRQDAVIFFTDRDGRSSPVSSKVLYPYFNDHDPLRLVVLDTHRKHRVDVKDAATTLALGLVRESCTAGVAMQFPLSEGAAATFTTEFYAALADGIAVDRAVTIARKVLVSGFATEWATPALVTSATDCQIFRMDAGDQSSG